MNRSGPVKSSAQAGNTPTAAPQPSWAEQMWRVRHRLRAPGTWSPEMPGLASAPLMATEIGGGQVLMAADPAAMGVRALATTTSRIALVMVISGQGRKAINPIAGEAAGGFERCPALPQAMTDPGQTRGDTERAVGPAAVGKRRPAIRDF